MLFRPFTLFSSAFICCLFILGCSEQHPQNQVQSTEELKRAKDKQQLAQYQQQFEQWKLTQDPQLIAEYEKFFQSKVKQVPTLYELTLNSHPLKAECQQHRFSLPPKKLWSNLVAPLQLIEQLQGDGYFAHYKIVSVYRSREANSCVHGAKASKHLSNFAVDFQTLDEHRKPYANHDEIDQKLCQFWHQQGKKHRLGLGLYSKQRFHIDTQGYRTWGIGFKSVSSPCLKAKKS
ncbi:MAG: hypothetical protein KA474_03460 [Acinetobacter sp.]|nr:hypothetical protein [Acinetobacter sp.]